MTEPYPYDVLDWKPEGEDAHLVMEVASAVRVLKHASNLRHRYGAEESTLAILEIARLLVLHDLNDILTYHNRMGVVDRDERSDHIETTAFTMIKALPHQIKRWTEQIGRWVR